MSKSFRGKEKASSSRAPQSLGPAFGGLSLNHSILSFVVEPLPLHKIEDPNVVVEFKALTKKDSMTKIKALQQLQILLDKQVERGGTLEDGILESWVRIYPRLSIDNDRRVRELSGSLHAKPIIRSSHARLLKQYAYQSIPCWVATMDDRDNQMAKQANENITSVVPDLKNLLRRQQPVIVKYALTAMQETPESLSDDRNVSPDDMQTIYHRVVGSALFLITTLLSNLNEADLVACQAEYDNFLSNEKVWSLIGSEDSWVRQHVYSLFEACVSAKFIENHSNLMINTFIVGGLRSPQTGTATRFLTILQKFCTLYPQIFTSSYKSKKPFLSRLENFISKGSQDSQDFWSTLNSTLKLLPTEVLPSGLEASLAFLQCYRTGTSQRNDQLWNVQKSRSSYLDTIELLFEHLTGNADKEKFVSNVLPPLFKHYLYENRRQTKPRENDSLNRSLMKFSATDSDVVSYQEYAILLAKVYKMSIVNNDHLLQVLGGTEGSLTDKFREKIKLALPESSAEYHASQNEVIHTSRLWFILVGQIWHKFKSWEQLQSLYSHSLDIINTAVSTLVTRKGKPYSAAGVIEAAIIHAPEFAKLPAILSILQGLIKDNISELIVSPSSFFVIQIMFWVDEFENTKDSDSFKVWLNSAIGGIINSPPGHGRESGTIELLLDNSKVAEQVQKHSGFQKFIFQSTIESGDDSGNAVIFEKALNTKSISSATTDSIRDHLIETLIRSDVDPLKSLRILIMMCHSRAGWESLASVRVDLMIRVLKFLEIPDEEIAKEASLLQMTIGDNDKPQLATVSEAILKSVVVVGPDAANIFNLIAVAKETIIDCYDSANAKFFPDLKEWTREVNVISAHKPNPALDTIIPFPGALNLVKWPEQARSDIQTDSMGYSSIMRKTLYVSSLFEFAEPAQRHDILVNLGLMVEIIGAKMTIRDGGNLFRYITESDHRGVGEFMSSNIDRIQHYAGQSSSGFHLNSWNTSYQTPSEDKTSKVVSLIKSYIENTSRGASDHSVPISYYAAKALCRLVRLISISNSLNQGPNNAQQWLIDLDIFANCANNTLLFAAVLLGFGSSLELSPLIARHCNDAVGNVVNTTPSSPKALEQLVFSRSCLEVYEDSRKLKMAEHRSMRLIDHLLSWDLDVMGAGVLAESCRVLRLLFHFHPEHRPIAGLDFCLQVWSRFLTESLEDEDIPVLRASLDLYSALEDTARRPADPAEDPTALQKEFKHLEPRIYTEVLKLLKLERHQTHGMQEYVDGQLLKVISGLDIRLYKGGPYQLYPLLASNSIQVQSAAFILLQRSLSDKQLELAIASDPEDSPPTNLEDELISLVISAPKAEDFDEDQHSCPPSARGYLLAWILIFESFSFSTLKVRSAYVEHLQRERCIDAMMPLFTDLLSGSVSVGETMTRAFDVLAATAPQNQSKEILWMVQNIYFLALNHVPYLVKSWVWNNASKQSRANLEKWTEKYMSPFIISDALNDVSTWAKNQNELQVKVSRTTREVTASYQVDESYIDLVIRFPAILGPVNIEGRNTVIKPQKWNGILMTTKAVLEFSNGSISDALDVFRKNIESTMKGVTECAICYSVVSMDKHLPDKKCGTCNNKFHGKCLFKWFTSSNANTCPLCRTQWAYGR